MQVSKARCQQIRQQLLVPVTSWGLAEVGRWVAIIGLPQYRKRFIHQGITGPLLLKLNHATLKVQGFSLEEQEWSKCQPLHSLPHDQISV